MASQNHISALQLKHRELERALAEEVRRPLPDADAMRALKRQKLRVKDLITSAGGNRARSEAQIG
jgi:hypothetical protein